MSNGQGDDEGGAFPGFALGANRAAVAIGDASADGEPDTGSLEFGPPMQTLEYREDFVGVFLVEPDSVVLNAQLTLLRIGVLVR